MFSGLTAQNIPINLLTGWNWIGYTCTEAMSLEEALADFTPAEGDLIKGINGTSMYQNGQWQGSLTELEPGLGYMYLSVSGVSKSFVFGGGMDDPSALPATALEGEFTVDSKGTKVRFSPGNLQCRIDPARDAQVTLGNGTAQLSQCPYSTLYNYSMCQMIYLASELTALGMAPGPVTGIAFESASTNCYLRNGIEIWMAPTTLTTIPSTSVSTAEMRKMYYGSVTQQTGWTEIAFTSSPIVWDGASNLLVTVVMNHGSYHSGTSWTCTDLGVNRVGYSTTDGSPYDPSSSTYTFVKSTKRPNTRFNGKGGVTWRFAENQEDYIGEENANASTSYGDWIDLFGWGTSGQQHGAVCWQPWSTSNTNSDYYAYNQNTCNLFDQTGEADWGVNAISNGDDQPNKWRTLTKEEWNYLLNTRSTPSGKRYVKAVVGGVNGLLLLPDNWSVSYYSLFIGSNSASTNFTSNTITESDWSSMEQHGVVFLPAGGWRSGTSYQGNAWGSYWSSTKSSTVGQSYSMDFGSSQLLLASADRCGGESVRLVCQTNPRVRTVLISDITPDHATVNGEVQYTGSETISERGFCVNTAGHPTVSDYHVHINQGTGPGSFSGQLTVAQNTTYHVRAYAKIGSTYRYGNELVFTSGSWATESPKHVFSEPGGAKVVFAPGNLQYCAATDTWRFAEHQWDYIGPDNTNASSTYEGWIDVFGWGTSNYNHGAVCYQPWSVTYSDDCYYAYGNKSYNLYDQTGKADWGYRDIDGHGLHKWETPSMQDWRYLLFERQTISGLLFVRANVNNVDGLILLPDDWDASYYAFTGANNAETDFDANVINSVQWTMLEEQYGAVFLPAAGWRSLRMYHSEGYSGNYWSSSRASDDFAYSLYFDGIRLHSFDTPYSHHRSYGLSVRLVREVQ